MDSSGDLFSDSASNTPAGTPVEFSDVSCPSTQTASHPIQSDGSQQSNPDDPTDILVGNGVEPASATVTEFTCTICKKVLKTQRGFRGHKLLHKVKDINLRKPTFEELQVDVMLLSEEVLQEIHEEPSFTEEGQEKKRVVVEILQCMETENWLHFLSTAATPVLQILSERKKVLPAKNYDENIRALNSLLAKEEYMQNLCDMLSLIVVTDTHTVMPRILYRFLYLMFTKLNQLIFNKMKGDCNAAELHAFSELQDREKSSFALIINKILRDQLKVRVGSSHSINRNFVKAIRNKFVVTVEGGVSTSDLVEPSAWTEDEDGNLKVQLSDHALKFFFGVENLIRSKPDSEVNFDLLLQVEAEETLNFWSSLTDGFCNEEESLYFLEEIFNVFSVISLKAEADKQCREWKQKNKEQRHALRTGLKRN